MKYRIHLLREDSVPKAHLRSVFQCFDDPKTSGPIQIIPVHTPVSLPKNKLLSASKTLQFIQKWREENDIPQEDFIYVLSATPNELNYFTLDDTEEGGRNGFGHVDEYDWITTAPSWVLSTHYLLTTVVKALILPKIALNEALPNGLEAPINELGIIGHTPPLGCFSDACVNKRDMSFKLRTADICEDCLTLFQWGGIPDSLIRQIVKIQEAIRPLALATSPYIPDVDTFSSWPFPIAITKHKASQARNPHQQASQLIDHFDSLIRYTVIALSRLNQRPVQIGNKPSLGDWVRALSTIHTNGTKPNQPIHYKKAATQITRIAEQEKLVQLRNETRGHGWTPTDEATSQEVIKTLQTQLLKIENILTPLLKDYQLLIPQDINLTKGKMVISGIKLQGSNSIHSRYSHSTESDITKLGISNTGHVYLANQEFTEFYDLHPWIIYDNCLKCHHERILIYDGENTYIDTFIGHRTSLKG